MEQEIELTTERLKLRAYKPQDWERVHSYCADPDFSKYQEWGPNSPEDTHKFIADVTKPSNPRYKFEFAICLNKNDLLIGGCGIRRETQTSSIANIGWAIHPDFQKQGYATEAAKALIDFGFEKLKLAVIYATCDTRNTASFKVMEKLGMTNVGRTKGVTEVKGYVRDSFRYELVAAQPAGSGILSTD